MRTGNAVTRERTRRGLPSHDDDCGHDEHDCSRGCCTASNCYLYILYLSFDSEYRGSEKTVL